MFAGLTKRRCSVAMNLVTPRRAFDTPSTPSRHPSGMAAGLAAWGGWWAAGRPQGCRRAGSALGRQVARVVEQALPRGGGVAGFHLLADGEVGATGSLLKRALKAATSSVVSSLVSLERDAALGEQGAAFVLGSLPHSRPV